MMEFDFPAFVSERHARLLQEMQEERRAATLPRQPRRNLLTLMRRTLNRWHGALATLGANRTTQQDLQVSEE